ncbi:MAG: tRNA pseudouridine(13) synthase TruD [Candidatus Omnitrophica bacterium]|nr:tRNA pseudouridine(13) synthase TruD [Candidatus Omnitrophota bacterium]
MKIKVKAEDFIVNEDAKLDFKEGGRFKVYLLTKKGLNTIEVLSKLAKKFNLPFEKFGYGGKKDKHALTTQYITIEDFKIENIKEKSFEINYLGDMARPMVGELILANEFKVKIRDLKEEEVNYALGELDFVKNFGFPNYFDDQRFGSYSPQQGFFAEKLIKKEFSGALKIYLTAIYPQDKKEERLRKKFFFDNWKNWGKCLLEAKTEFEKKAFKSLLKDKKSFLKILGMIPKEELNIFVSSFQGYLWNNLVERLIKLYDSQILSYHGNYWSYFFYISKVVFDYLKEFLLPLASQKTKMTEEISDKIYRELLDERKLKPSFFNLRKFRKVYFRPTLRKVIVIPEIKEISFFKDELYKNKKVLYLHFRLLRGSYATMLIKRLFAQ